MFAIPDLDFLVPDLHNRIRPYEPADSVPLTSANGLEQYVRQSGDADGDQDYLELEA